MIGRILLLGFRLECDSPQECRLLPLEQINYISLSILLC